MPAVSVIIPAYNAERYVSEAVVSAMDQTYRDREIIVVDDGSTDGTADQLAQFETNITFIAKQHSGVAAARNAALRKATGEFVAFLDADDMWDPNHLDVIVGALKSGRASSVVTDARLVGEGIPEGTSFYSSRPKRLRFRRDDQIYWIHQYNFVLGFAITRMSNFGRFGEFDESLRTLEDWDLWLRFISGGEAVTLIDQPTGSYRRHSRSLTADRMQLLLDEKTVLEKASSAPSAHDVRGLSGRLSFARAKLELATGDRSAAVLGFKAAARDQAVPPDTRLRAALAAKAPGLAARLYLGNIGREGES